MSEQQTQQPKPRIFKREQPKREQTDDNKIYVSANTYMSRLIGQVNDSFGEKKMNEVVVRGLGRGAEIVMRSRVIIQRITGCHAVVKTELFNSDINYTCEEGEKKTTVTVKQSSICVEILFSKEAPKDTTVAGYFAPLTEEQKEALQPRGNRRRRRPQGRRYFDKRPQGQQRQRREEQPPKEEKEKPERKEEPREERRDDRRERRQQGGNQGRRNNGPRGYGRGEGRGEGNRYGRYRDNYGNK